MHFLSFIFAKISPLSFPLALAPPTPSPFTFATFPRHPAQRSANETHPLFLLVTATFFSPSRFIQDEPDRGILASEEGDQRLN